MLSDDAKHTQTKNCEDCAVTENLFQSQVDAENATQDKTKSLEPAHAVYNVVTDTVSGVNVRWSDNKFQAIFVLISMVVSSLLGALLAVLNSQWDLPWYGGALVGSFAGLVIGIFASGIFLMFYRAARHIKGKHD
ncbi:MAG: hypothetical protein ABL888_09605 [Pirellulaceae bacterium]